MNSNQNQHNITRQGITDFTRLFTPASVAHVGASAKEAIGRFNFTQYFIDMKYTGRIYPVNPKYKEILGLTCYAGLADIPGPVDLAILAVPAQRCLEILREVPAGKVKFVVIHTSGFGEIDRHELDLEILRLGREKKFRIVGPNCMGVYSQPGRIGFWQGHWEIVDQPGAVGFVSQSGGHGVNLVLSGMNTGIFFNKVLSLGNQIDVSINEVLAYLGDDDSIEVIGIYVEEVGDGRSFQDLLRRIISRKPVIVWKGGVTRIGKEAAATHTGSMAGNERIFEAAMRQAGVVQAAHLHEMAHKMRLLQPQFSLPGSNLAIFSPGGGNAVNVCDLFSAQPNICLPRLSPETTETLRELLPEENVDVRNPIDPGATGYMKIDKLLMAVADDPRIDTILVLFGVDYLSNVDDEEKRESIVEMISEIIAGTARDRGIPIYVLLRQQRANHRDYDHYRRLMLDKFIEKSIPWLDGTFKEAAEIISDLAGYRNARSAKSRLPE